MKLLVLALGVFGKTFDEALLRPFEGYCARAPEAQQRAVPQALPADLLEAMKLELRGVQMAFRHGARDLSSDKACFEPMQPAFKNCSVRTLVSFTGLAPSEPRPLIREVLDAYPLREAELAGSGLTSGIAGCGLGVLLDEAIPQTKALAGALRKYFHRLPQEPTSKTTRLYSTGKLRTEATLFLMHRELFGDAPGTQLHSRPVLSDPWDMNQYCPRAGEARHARHLKTSLELIRRRFPAFAEEWKRAAGTDFQAGFHDCLLVAKCSDQEQLKLPEQLQPESSLFNDALRVSLDLFQQHYMQDPEALHLLAAPVLIELERFMYEQANSSSVLALWATHDTTILVVLAALGVWNGQWPPYTDTMVLEVYTQTGSQSRAFFRFLHHGVPVVFPWCAPISSAPGLCAAESFLPPWIAPFRDMQRLRDACEAPKPLVLALGTGHEGLRSVLFAGLFASLFMYLGYAWKSLEFKWATPSREALLVSAPA